MDRYSSMERRYSFNASIKNPAAESTKLNHSSANRSGLGTSFKWGSSPISPKQRSDSSVNLDRTVGGDGLESSRCRSMRKIDPRIVADVQSRGLASRIVKYHENGNRLNRSMSAHNLYTKPGQFPVVTLKKTDLPYRATKQNVSMTRIAPPEKSVFYGNTLSSLLRSNSVVGLHKSDEDISRENRPILHPPPTENDMAPTRSVLDVLKEISRKRINSDDPDVVETSKKNRIGNDLVDTGAQTMLSQSYKRQRDLNSPHNGEVGSPSKFQDTRFSPEQAKKRVCNYSNDITSSLSSSIKRKPNANKRPSYQLNQTMPTSLEYYETQKNKTLKSDSRNTDIRFDNIENSSTSKVVSTNVATSTVPDGNVYGAIPQRSKSEPIPSESGKISVPNKPRLTLFNKAYDVNNGHCENEEAERNLDESGECAGIQFVKPKKLSSAGMKNPVIERAQKSKLALMLSGLRGELYYESDNDELDAPKQAKEDKQNNVDSKTVREKKPESGGVNVVTTTPAALPNTSIISSKTAPVAATAANKLPEKADTTNNKTQFTMKAPSSNTSPLVGLKLSPPTTAANVVTTTQKSEVTQSVTTPTLQGFACSSAASMAQTPASFSTTTAVSFGAMTQPTVASKSLASSTSSQPADIAKSSTNTAQVATICFGNLAKTTTTTPLPPANTFAFSPANEIKVSAGNNSVTTAANVPSTVPPTAVTTAPSVSVSSSSTTTASTIFSNNFSFGSNIATTSAPSQNQTFVIKPIATSASAAAPFSFGTPSNVQTTAAGTPAVKSSGGFSLTQTTTAPATANTQFSFGSAAAPNNNNTPTAGNLLSFGSSTNNDKLSMFNTGAPKPAPTLTSTTDATKPLFGLPGPAAAPLFGSTATTTAANIFGSSNAPQAQSMFGSNAPKTDFGSEGSKPSTFGGTSAAQAQSVFGSNAPKTTFGTEGSKPSTFGSTSAPQAQSMFGSNAPKTTFGSEASKPATFGGTSAAQAQSVFGSNDPKTTFGTDGSKPSTFGGTSVALPGIIFGQPVADKTASVNKPAASAGGFSFGATTAGGSNTTPAPSGPSKTFSFGSGAVAPENNNATNIFGGSAPSGPRDSSDAGFSFGSSANTAAAQKPLSTFAFGAPNSSSVGGNASQSAGGFSFGSAMQQKPNDTSLAKPFSFGTSAPNNNQALAPTIHNPAASNMFAANMMNKPASPAFNFGGAATSTPQATVAPVAANNIFAFPASVAASPGSGDRPIRRATRRLQK